MQWSKPLAAEIEKVSTSANDTYVKFRNTSKIIVYTANDNARGNRSHASCREEFRQIDKKIEDSVISPFQTVRNRPYFIFSIIFKIQYISWVEYVFRYLPVHKHFICKIRRKRIFEFLLFKQSETDLICERI